MKKISITLLRKLLIDFKLLNKKKHFSNVFFRMYVQEPINIMGQGLMLLWFVHLEKGNSIDS